MFILPKMKISTPELVDFGTFAIQTLRSFHKNGIYILCHANVSHKEKVLKLFEFMHLTEI